MMRPWRLMLWLLAGIVLFGLAPLIAALAAGGIGEALGCIVNEAGTNPCLVAGTDIGTLLAFFFVLGWLTLVTGPVAALAFGVWTVAALILLLLRIRRNKTVGWVR